MRWWIWLICSACLRKISRKIAWYLVLAIVVVDSGVIEVRIIIIPITIIIIVRAMKLIMDDTFFDRTGIELNAPR